MKNLVFLFSLIFLTNSLFSQIPFTPSNLYSHYISTSALSISWQDNSTNESGFVIERRTDGTNWSQIVTVQPNSTYYVDMNLLIQTKYYYRIYAFNSYGNSSYSNEITAIIGILPDCSVGTDTISTPYPFYTTYTDSRTQILYRKSDMFGYCTIGSLWTISFFSKSQTMSTINNVTIKMKNTTDTVLTKFIDTGMTVVYNNYPLTIPSYGWFYISLNPMFTWDINKNLLVEICYHSTSALATNLKLSGSAAPNKVWHRHKLSSNGCTLDSGSVINIQPNFRMNTLIDGVKKISSFTPDNYSIDQNYPNPFNGDTKFKFKIKEYSPATLSLYDVLGRQTVVVFSEPLSPGEYEKTFSLSEHPLPSGIYYYCFVTREFVSVKKMVVLK